MTVPTLDQVATTLRKEAQASGKVTISSTLLGDPAFKTLVEEQLRMPSGELKLDASSVPSPSASELTFACTLPTDGFLNLGGNTAKVTVTAEPTGLAFTLRVTLHSGKTTNWVWSTSFPELRLSLLDDLTLSGPVVWFRSVGQPAGAQGLTFETSTSFTGALAPASSVLASLGGSNAQLATLQGPITVTEHGPDVALEASLGLSKLRIAAMALDIVKPVLGVRAALPASDGDGGLAGVIECAAYLGGRIGFATADDQPAELPVTIVLPTGTGSRLMLSGFGADQKTSLDKLGGLLAGHSWNDLFPDCPNDPAAPLRAWLARFGLRAYGITFAMDGADVTVHGITLAVGTLPQTAPIMLYKGTKGNIDLEDFQVVWSFPFTSGSGAVAVDATIGLFDTGLTFGAALTMPQMLVACALRSEPGVKVGQLARDLAVELGGTPPGDLQVLDDLEIRNISFELDKSTNSIAFSIATALEVGDQEVDFQLDIRRTGGAASSIEVVPKIQVGSALLAGRFSTIGQDTRLELNYYDTINPITISTIVEGLGYGKVVPEELNVGLSAFDLTYSFTDRSLTIAAAGSTYGKAVLAIARRTGKRALFFFGLRIDHDLDITNLPLVGEALAPLQSARIGDLQLLAASELTGTELPKEIRALLAGLDASYPRPPSEGMPGRVVLSMVADLGGYTVPLAVGLGGTQAQELLEAGGDGTAIGTPGGDLAAPVPTTPAAEASGTTWFNVQKAFGPVTFRRVGVRYDAPTLWVAIDARFTAAGLGIDLMGLAAGSSLQEFDPRFQLDGMSVDFSARDLTIAGSFLRIAQLDYAGGLVVRARDISLAAFGEYAVVDGTPSMFVFAQLTGRLGGPPSFTVTGLEGGFGYNSRLQIPTIDEVAQFPLVQGLDDPSVVGGRNASALAVLRVLLQKPWVTHDIGQNWIAAGLAFTSFETVKTNALVIAQFGRRFQFALIGRSTARFPRQGPSAYANIELQLAVVYDPQVGEFSARAALSPSSFVIDPACRLTGGFAYEMWFGDNPNAGDFVLTLGGYHPRYAPPKHYPQVPKVGLSWPVDSTVSITGDLYFALTPQALMAGGQLSVTYRDGGLAAWFKAWANMLVFFEPFRFEIDIGVTIGASYTFTFLGVEYSPSVELGATLTLWGPPTGGTVYVSWWVISFTISFGASRSARPTPTWADVERMLPAPAERLRLNPVDGLLPSGKTDQSGEPWRVRPAGFRFTTGSAIPLSAMAAGDQSPFAGKPLDIRPLNAKGLTSKHTLKLEHDGSDVDLTDWTVTAREASVPSALWGTGAQDALIPAEQQLLPDRLVGLDVAAPAPDRGASPGPLDVTVLGADRAAPGELPVEPGVSAQGPRPQISNQTLGLIRGELMGPGTTAERAALHQALGTLGVNPGGDGDLTSFAATVETLFGADPMLLPITPAGRAA